MESKRPTGFELQRLVVDSQSINKYSAYTNSMLFYVANLYDPTRGYAYISQSRLALATGISTRTLRRVFIELDAGDDWTLVRGHAGPRGSVATRFYPNIEVLRARAAEGRQAVWGGELPPSLVDAPEEAAEAPESDDNQPQVVSPVEEVSEPQKPAEKPTRPDTPTSNAGTAAALVEALSGSETWSVRDFCGLLAKEMTSRSAVTRINKSLEIISKRLDPAVFVNDLLNERNVPSPRISAAGWLETVALNHLDRHASEASRFYGELDGLLESGLREGSTVWADDEDYADILPRW